MVKDAFQRLASRNTKAHRLEKEWQELCERYLPLSTSDSLWRHYHVAYPDDPEQGWKLHITATVLNACRVLSKVAPFLIARAVRFKAPRSLEELARLNSGLFYGYSQVGKFITVYPRTPEDAVSLARLLHHLTRRMGGPSVPFDLRYSKTSNVYYRFGAFQHLETENADGQPTLAIRDAGGNLVPDVRVAENAKPDWVTSPFRNRPPRAAKRTDQSSRLRPFRVFRALVQRGKGGVYQAVDLSVSPARPCLLKEGRKNGETAWDGRDGVWRVRNEERVISTLRSHGVDAPRIFSSFELDGNFYLVTEFIDGESLHNLLLRRARRLSMPRVLGYGRQLCEIFRRIHAAGWVWRDCKPVNILVTRGGRLRPIDFEGACPSDAPDPMFWGTPGFSPPEQRDFHARTCFSDDLYALGAMLYLLVTGRVPEVTEPLPVEKLRRHVPRKFCELVMLLLSHDPVERPSAETVEHELVAALAVYELDDRAHTQNLLRPVNPDGTLGCRRRKPLAPHARRTGDPLSRWAATEG